MLINMKVAVFLSLGTTAYSFAIPAPNLNSHSLTASKPAKDYVCDGGALGKLTITGQQIADAKRGSGKHYADSNQIFGEW